LFDLNYSEFPVSSMSLHELYLLHFVS